MNKADILCVLWVAAWVGAAGDAAAAAWTQEPGAAFVSLTTTALRPNEKGAVPEGTLAVYAEYGVVDRFTVGGGIELKLNRDLGFAGETALSAAGFARYRLREGAAGDPLSVQLGLIGPLREPDPATGLFADDLALDARMLYGRGFSTGWGDAFVSGEAGVRLSLDGEADEGKLDLTAGLRPTARTLVMVQSFLTIGQNGSGPGGSDVDEWKVTPSLGYVVGPATVLVGVEQSVGGRKADRGTRFRLSIWRSF